MSDNNDIKELTNWANPLADKEKVTLPEFMETYKSRITQDSERLFVSDFLFPLLGEENIKYVIPQYPFLDSEGRTRRIDFVLVKGDKKIALEVNGETYHAEGVIAKEVYDDNLNRQNEILSSGYFLLRYSYSQLQHPTWRKQVSESIRRLVYRTFPEILAEGLIEPNHLQQQALNDLDVRRNVGWKKGIVVLPTGTGKTFLSAFDTKKVAGKILFIVHRLDILSQSKEAFEKVYPKETLGLLTGEVKENVNARILFASKDTLRNPETLYKFKADEFDYIIVDEVHHGQAQSYQIILDYFKANFFMLGLTATPDRMDRKDIFELFDYQKVFEFTLNEAIEKGFLVPYNYYGLKDNIDYSQIRYRGNKYNVADLDRHLIIKERNEQILKEYLEKGKSYKAVGFCASIKHANAMAKFFNENGIPSQAITAETPNRDELIKQFRESKFTVAFTVDLFNEGVDFPDLRVLLFLRPTESKTVFIQQLGRGLRLCNGKENVVILDFISNYEKAGKIREYLAKGKDEQKNAKGRIEKVVYEYSPKCEVHFDAAVEQILDNQDRAAREITKEDLIDAYYTLAETLGHKPTQQEINEQGEFKIAKYLSVFGSWVRFLREIGEFTEASYHFPQGVHLGHIMYILKTLLDGNLKRTHLDEKYIRLRGNLGEDRLGAFQRQTKYKLQALMELGLIVDDRKIGADIDYQLKLTPQGKQFAEALKPVLKNLDLSFKKKEGNVPSWEMNTQPSDFNEALKIFVNKNTAGGAFITATFLEMHAVGLMLNYLYRVERKKSITKRSIYDGFFKASFVATYCDQNGIETATVSGAEHRCPFLLNILESLGIIEQETSSIELQQFILSKQTIQLNPKETEKEIFDRIALIEKSPAKLSAEDTSLLKEAFGKDFLTKNYFLTNFKIVK
jgi:superfamily II DNA or RNA helicase